MRTIPLVLCLALVLFAQPGRGQTLSALHGEIVSTVTDVEGAVIPGAHVALSGVVERSAITNELGLVVFKALPPGAYVLRATLAGFRTTEQRVDVVARNVATVRMMLTVSSLQETVTVTAASPSINASRTSAEEYAHLSGNGFRRVANYPLSTFSVDVDTASYANVRRFLTGGELPPPDAVRVEELVNYFRFDYVEPRGDHPLAITAEFVACPWNKRHRLALIGLKARDVAPAALPPRNLVFLIDVSGSMQDPNKLPLVRQGLRMLTATLTERDRVAIVVYAGASGLVLPSTSGSDRAAIDRALAELEAGGSTNGGEGLRLAYREARANFVPGGVNRVLLATDGDFNVGVTSQSELVRLIEQERETGVFLSVLGVGQGNLKDATMEALADKGNGNYSYLDSLLEARKVLVEEAGGTLVVVAKDAKIQVEFNPAVVTAYRLVGYENRLLADEDFADDAKDAGDIGAGHTVTALFEIVPAGVEPPVAKTQPLRYQAAHAQTPLLANEALTVHVRYKTPEGQVSRHLATSLASRVESLGPNAGFASAVAEFALALRGAEADGRASLARAAGRARRYRGPDPAGHRAEFVRLAELAESVRRREANGR